LPADAQFTAIGIGRSAFFEYCWEGTEIPEC
jgi:hypothetical protein